MVRAYVEAGFSKIHLDASMACADDRGLAGGDDRRTRGGPLRRRGGGVRRRGPRLCDRHRGSHSRRRDGGARLARGDPRPRPRGERSSCIARPSRRRESREAIGKVIALVVQPGVDMGNTQVFAYDRAKAAALSAAVLDVPGVVYEAHSTDFQTEAALASLVATHFAILKVGPALTFAFREAVVAMAAIEERLVASGRSDVLAVLEQAMDDNPVHWRGYVAADGAERVGRLFGLSDRVRYYWPEPRVDAAVKTLTRNIDAASVPPGLVSQYRRRDAPGGRRILCRGASSRRKSARSSRDTAARPALAACRPRSRSPCDLGATGHASRPRPLALAAARRYRLRPCCGSHRLAAQDVALSRRKQGLEFPLGAPVKSKIYTARAGKTARYPADKERAP